MSVYLEFLEIFLPIIYVFFIPIFLTSLVVTVPLAKTRGRIVLKILLGLGVICLIFLIWLATSGSYGGLGLAYIGPYLVPSLIAGFLSLLLIGEAAKKHKYPRMIIAVILVGACVLVRVLVPYTIL